MERLGFSVLIRISDSILSELSKRDVWKIGILCSGKDFAFNFIRAGAGGTIIVDFKALLNTKEYDFLKTNPRLGKRMILLGVVGSYGYGTNREGSDVDFRGVTLNLSSDLLGLTDFKQYVDDETDTVVYSFNKIDR